MSAQNAVAGDGQVERAQQHFAREAEAIAETYRQRLARHVQQQEAILQARARRLLEQAALIEIALGRQRSLFESESYPTGFNQEAVKGLVRHGGTWQCLLVVATNRGKSPLPQPESTDPYYEQIQNEKTEKLKTLFTQIAEEAGELVQSWRRVTGS